MITDPKKIVATGYEACGLSYSAARAFDADPELLRLIDVLPAQARVLDIGCGAGQPVTATLARVADVVGVDVSQVQIERARRDVPNAKFVVGDIMSQAFEPSSFDAVVSFYAIFHLPRDEHRALLERVSAWLRPGGHLLMTLADTSHPGYTEPDFFGTRMYWSHFEPQWYSSLVIELGFEILAEGVLGHGYEGVLCPPEERHPFLFAKSTETGARVT